jgi:hypothetical protein
MVVLRVGAGRTVAATCARKESQTGTVPPSWLACLVSSTSGRDPLHPDEQDRRFAWTSQ